MIAQGNCALGGEWKKGGGSNRKCPHEVYLHSSLHALERNNTFYGTMLFKAQIYVRFHMFTHTMYGHRNTAPNNKAGRQAGGQTGGQAQTHTHTHKHVQTYAQTQKYPPLNPPPPPPSPPTLSVTDACAAAWCAPIGGRFQLLSCPRRK